MQYQCNFNFAATIHGQSFNHNPEPWVKIVESEAYFGLQITMINVLQWEELAKILVLQNHFARLCWNAKPNSKKSSLIAIIHIQLAIQSTLSLKVITILNWNLTMTAHIAQVNLVARIASTSSQIEARYKTLLIGNTNVSLLIDSGSV